jgi:chemotaxis protein CheD
MAQLVVGIGDCRVSKTNGDVLVTYALGSCIGVMVYDPGVTVAGLLHILLPESRLDPVKAQTKPFIFADTGIPLLIQQCFSLGARKERLITRIAGGSQMSTSGGVLNVGVKNIRATKQILSRAGIVISGEAIGGSVARTVRLTVATGEIAMHESTADSKKVFLSCIRVPNAA